MTAPMTPESWARDLLTRMNYPVTDNNVTSVLAWEYQEGGHFANGATYNPLNTTLGHATYGAMNGAGVATYPDYETGMTETIKTLNLHYYDKIRADLQAGADPSATTADIKASPWGTWHGGASTAGALKRAHSTLSAHHPSPAATTAPAAAPIPAAATSTAHGFEGADVDGLDRLAAEFTQAAQVCDEVRAACAAIVAAASFFGPFGAAFIAYLKGVVIPWLTKISEALQLMARVLSAHSQAQKDASSSATSLPSYATPANLPAAGTGSYPVMTAAPTPTTPGSVATSTTSYLGGLVTVGTDKAGNVVDVAVGGSSPLVADEAHYHLDRDAAGNVVAVSETGQTGVLGVPLVRTELHASGQTLADATGHVTDLHTDGSLDVVLGPGTGQGATPAGSLPGGAQLPDLPGSGDEAGFHYHPPEVALGWSASSGPTYGTSEGGSVLVRAIGVDYGGSGQDGLLGLGTQLHGSVEGNAGFFVGDQTFGGQTTRGTFAAGDAGAAIGLDGGARLGTDHTNLTGTAAIGIGPGVGAGGWAIQHGPTGAPGYDLGGYGDVKEVRVGGDVHHDGGSD